ncbi:MAG: glycosyltransferase [Gemmatimonadota bacterium]
MKSVTIGLINVNQSGLTIAMLEHFATLRDRGWTSQLVLVDNGSESDDLATLMAWEEDNRSRFGDSIFVNAGENLGAAAGRNRILERADGDRILIVDNDLELDDLDWLDRLWALSDANPEAGLVGPMLVFARQPDVVQAAGIGLTQLGRVGYLHRGEKVADVPPTTEAVVASPAACWLMDRDAQQAVGDFPEIYYPMQYWDVDFCMGLGAHGSTILCDRSIRVRHIVNTTTRSMGDHVFARTAVRHGIIFRERWGERLSGIETIEDPDIYWGPIPRP